MYKRQGEVYLYRYSETEDGTPNLDNIEDDDCLLYTSPDGRAITEIRHLAAEVDLLPRVHGSGMFTRGQTQILNACTLAPLSEAQKLDGLDENETSKRYMHHYNFPSFSVGETKPSRGPGRREIGPVSYTHLIEAYIMVEVPR